MDNELPRLRRFALTIGSILFLFSLSGVTFPPSLKATILGVEFAIKREFVDWGLVLASVYASTHYYYVACFKLVPPWVIRKRLRNMDRGVPIHGENPEHFIRRFYPGASPSMWVLSQDAGPERDRFALSPLGITKRIRILSAIDSLDYLLPVIVNAVGLTCLLLSWGARHE